MRLGFVIVIVPFVAACVDTNKCHMPSDWKPCSGEMAQPGAGGTPPTIVSLSMPTCAYVDTPSASGALHVSDPEGDAQVVKATFYAGARVNESEVQLPDAGRSGNDWTGMLTLTVPGTMQVQMPRSLDVRIKVTDRAGNQSAPVCNTFSLVQ
jgi:hypothetical protein